MWKKQKQNLTEHKEVIHMIPDFIEKNMDYHELELFLEHVRSCPDCLEELSIQFLVFVGLESLEDGNNFDLQAELNSALESAGRRVRGHRMVRKILTFAGLFWIAALVVTGILVFLFWNKIW